MGLYNGSRIPPPNEWGGFLREGIVNGMVRRTARSRAPTRGPVHWSQSYPFTCGPAALGSVLSSLGWDPAGSRAREELALWRECTAVACPGAHPLGLALAAHARGFSVELWESGPRPWLGAHVVNAHRLLRGPAYGRVERLLADASRSAGISRHRGRGGPGVPAPGLLLVTEHGGPSTPPDPHWIGLVPTPDGGWWVHDPVRRTAIRSTRTLREWWETSGFEGTKSWIALGSGVPASADAGEDPHSPHVDPVRAQRHGPSRDPERRPTELARRGWTRAEAIAALDSPERGRTQDPATVVRHAGLRAGQTVVEVGAGTGYFALPAARAVGPGGRVFAVDISEELVRLLKERANAEHLGWLRAVQSTEERIPLPTGAADVVLLANVLHDIPASTLQEAIRLLRPGGRLVNVDWGPGPTPHGPPASVRISPAAARRLLGEHGLRTIEEWPFGPWHYGLTLIRPVRARAGPEAPGGR